MARIFTSGFELNQLGATSAEGWITSGTAPPVISNLNVRSGAFALRHNNAINVGGYVQQAFTGVAEVFVRFYIKLIDTNQTSDRSIVRIIGNAGTQYLGLKIQASTNKLMLFQTATQRGVTTAALTLGQWTKVEMRLRLSSTSAIHEMIALGQTITDTTADTTTENAIQLRIGFLFGETYTNDMYIDDVAINDTTGAAQNTYPGEGKVIQLKPIVDNVIGGWTAGSTGTTNLFDAIDNTPPAGVATDTIFSAVTNIASNPSDNYDVQVQSYTTGGVGASDTISLVQIIARHGEDIATGTKAGAATIVSNPAQGAETTFNFGLDAGAHGAEIGFWRTTYGPVQYAPSVTKSTNPVIRVGKRSATTAKVCVDSAGLLVEYVPAGGVTTPRTIAGVARIAATSVRQLLGVSAIKQTTLRTILGVATITTTKFKPILGVASIQKTTARLLTGVADIFRTTQRTVTGVADIKSTTVRTLLGAARIQTTNPKTIAGVADIKKTVAQLISGVADVKVTTARTITGVGDVKVTVQRIVTGVGDIKGTTQRTITGLGDIKGTTARTVTGRASVLLTVQRAITGVATLLVGSVQKNIQGRSRIQKTIAQTLTGITRILKTVNRDITGVADIKSTATRTVTGVGNIKVIVQRTITGVATLLIGSVQRNIQGRSRIQKTISQTLTGIARILKTVNRDISGVADIARSTPRNIDAHGRIQKTVQAAISAVARIALAGATKFQTITGVASIISAPMSYALTAYVVTLRPFNAHAVSLDVHNAPVVQKISRKAIL